MSDGDKLRVDVVYLRLQEGLRVAVHASDILMVGYWPSGLDADGDPDDLARVTIRYSEDVHFVENSVEEVEGWMRDSR